MVVDLPELSASCKKKGENHKPSQSIREGSEHNQEQHEANGRPEAHEGRHRLRCCASPLDNRATQRPETNVPICFKVLVIKARVRKATMCGRREFHWIFTF